VGSVLVEQNITDLDLFRAFLDQAKYYDYDYVEMLKKKKRYNMRNYQSSRRKDINIFNAK
jgi:hypothetical protein